METNVFKFLWQYLSKLKLGFFSVMITIIIGEFSFKAFTYFGSEIADLLASDLPKEEILEKSLIFVLYGALCLVLHRIGYDSTFIIEAKFLPVYLSRISKNLFYYAHQHSTAFFAEEMAGNISSKIKTIIDNSYMIYYNILWGFLYPIFSMMSVFYFMSKVSWSLTGLLMGMNIIYVVFVYIISQKVAPYSERRARTMSESQGVLVDSISNSALVKGFSNFLFEKKNYFKYVKKWANAERDEIIKFGILYIYQGIIRIILQITFCLIPLWYWYEEKITIGEFVLVQTLIYSVSGLYFNFTQTFMQFFKFYGGIQDGLKLLSKPYDVVDVPDAKPLSKKAGDIVFDNVYYHYKGTEPLFKDFNLTIKKGEKIGLVGHSGAGKSSLIKILSRNYDIQGGEIRIGKQNIKKVTQDSLREAISLIPQDPSLFNRSVADNIRYGKINATDKEIIEAAKKAFCHDFIIELPNGYNTQVGERGSMLSGGERQRIAIARAILKDAPILVLDEATSALDSQSEKYIQESLKYLMDGKTVIAIAHRLSTLREMDKIVVMDKGKIVEEGSHNSLLRKKGVYHSFYEMQSQGFLKMNEKGEVNER